MKDRLARHFVQPGVLLRQPGVPLRQPGVPLRQPGTPLRQPGPYDHQLIVTLKRLFPFNSRHHFSST